MNIFYRVKMLKFKTKIVSIFTNFFGVQRNEQINYFVSKFIWILFYARKMIFLLIYFVLWIRFIDDINNEDYMFVYFFLHIFAMGIIFFVLWILTYTHGQVPNVKKNYFYQIYPDKVKFSNAVINYYTLEGILIYASITFSSIVYAINNLSFIYIIWSIVFFIIFYIALKPQLIGMMYTSRLKFKQTLTNKVLRFQLILLFLCSLTLIMVLGIINENNFNESIFPISIGLIIIFILLLVFKIIVKKNTKGINLTSYIPSYINKYTLTDTNIVSCKNVSYSYKKNEVLKDITVNIKSNKKYVLLGKNGIGKTTLLKCLNNINNNFDGEIKIGSTIFMEAESDINFDVTVNDFYILLKYIDPNIRKERYYSLLKEYNMDVTTKSLLKEFSLGMKHKMYLIGGFMLERDVFLIDEPIANFDPIAYRVTVDAFEKLTEYNKTVIVSTHLMHFAYRYADIVLIIKDGKLVEVVNDFETLKIFEEEIVNILTDEVEV